MERCTKFKLFSRHNSLGIRLGSGCAFKESMHGLVHWPFEFSGAAVLRCDPAGTQTAAGTAASLESSP